MDQKLSNQSACSDSKNSSPADVQASNGSNVPEYEIPELVKFEKLEKLIVSGE